LRAAKFRHGAAIGNTGVQDVAWFRADGEVMAPEDWGNGNGGIGLMLSGRAQRSLLIIANRHPKPLPFALPDRAGAVQWRLLIDSGEGVVEPQRPAVASAKTLSVGERSILLLETVERLA
jgi:isoamylase